MIEKTYFAITQKMPDMKKILALVMLVTTLFACSTEPTPEETEKELRKSMQNFLEKPHEGKPQNAVYEVKDVTYFPGKEFFECEFVVHVKTDTQDTTGVMKAKVSRDFSKVIRRL
jgi:hypothetical protein